MSVEVQRLQDAAEPVDTAFDTTAGHRKMRRTAHFVSIDEARQHALRCAVRGDKIGIMCGSKT
jgi:hypothetical protein